MRTVIDSFPPKRRALSWILTGITIAFVLAMPGHALGQLPGISIPKAAPSSQQETDPLGRSTPRGTVEGFIRVAHRNDYASAVQYMQANDSPRAETQARQLKELMDRYFNQPMESISNAPSGALDDGLPLDQERAGHLVVGGEPFDIILVRIDDSQFGLIWVISKRTLSRASAVYDTMEKPWIDRVMPDALLNRSVAGVSLAQAAVWIASIVLPVFVLWGLSKIYILLARHLIRSSARRIRMESWYTATRWPVALLCTLGVHLAAVSALVASLRVRIVYGHIVTAVAIVLLAWLLKRIAKLLFENLRLSLAKRGRTETESLILLGERLLNAIIMVVAVFLILTGVGVDTRTALAGVGIGGVAIAFGAQKTVENLFGGIFLLADQALAIGDTCVISNRTGVVEDITLRSVRVCTQEQTLLSVPAGALAQESIENLASRKKTLVQTKLPLRYGTTVEQIRSILKEISQLVKENPQIERESAWVRLVNFGARSIEVELFAYILTGDSMTFLAAQESLLMNVAGIVESAGSGFASPTQFVYMDDPSHGNNGLRDAKELQRSTIPRQNRRAS
jgi:MscS family membrane protein